LPRSLFSRFRSRAYGDELPAVILVGGEGTRLRPLTEHTPKPMLPLLGEPLLTHTFDHLRNGGVKRAILACGYLPTAIEAHFGSSYDGLALDYRVEPEPLGTGGAIRFAGEDIDETFLALNGDSLRDADLRRLVEFHRTRKAKATILLTRVSDPGRYGLVRVDDAGRVRGFVEKPRPEQIDTNAINAGMYVLEPEVLDLIPAGRSVSIEREVFPALVEEGSLFALALPGYWLDVGTRESYLQAHIDMLWRHGGVRIDPSAEVSDDVRLIPPLVIGARARIDQQICLGPFVHVGDDAHVGRRAAVRWAAVLPKAQIAAGACIARAIVSPETGALSP
jgi:mannose-1-phosphate guanylyltransferase